jgi:concanavalin A-like lectin/glucanase superfamily protein
VSAYSSAVLADAPSFYARLGETSGTSAADAVGGAAGTYTGGFTIPTPGLMPADADGAVTVNGTGYVTVAHRTALDLGDTFTLECIVKPTAFRDSGGLGGCMVDLGSGCPIMRFADALDGRFILRRNSVATLVTSTAAVPLNVASHVAITKSGATVHQYLNGVDVTGTVTNSTMASNALPLVIGAADGGADNFLTGVIDEAAIYKVALSAARVQAHYLIAVRARTLATAGVGG